MSTDLILYIAIASAVLYALSAVLISIKSTKKIGTVTWIIAVIGNAVMVGNNWAVNGYVPFVSMYQVLTFLALVFAPIYLYMKYYHKSSWMAVYFCAAPAICLVGVCFMGIGSVWHFPPALQSVWFVPHILVYMIGYSLSAVSFIITIISLFDEKNRDRLDTGTYHLICTAFPFMTMGMLFGAIWANSIWGNFWSFDAKENWSLITWLMYAIYLHFRRHPSLRRFAKIFSILGFIGVVITMLFVNVMGGSSQHAYSM